MIALEIAAITLAVWRLSRFIRKEPGPKQIMRRIRKLLGADNLRCYDDGSIKELCTCNKCLSWHLSYIFLASWWLLRGERFTLATIGFGVVLTFTVSGITLFLESIDEHLGKACEEQNGSEHEPAPETGHDWSKSAAVICPGCGVKNAAQGALICLACGSPLAKEDHELPSMS